MQLTPASMLFVAVGGATGSVLRHGVEELLGTSAGWPVGTLAVNLLGAFALGVLLEWSARRLDAAGRGADDRRVQTARLLVGTGLLGGFTTYSALALQTDGLLRDGRPQLAAAYALSTVVVGLVASLAGMLLARRAAR